MLYRNVVIELPLPCIPHLTVDPTLLFLGMHRKSMEAAETLKNDDSGGSDREDSASKASDSSMHSPPHSRSFSNSNGNGSADNNNQREQNNNKISMGNHNSGHSPATEHHKSPTYKGSPGPGGDQHSSEKVGPPMGLHSSHLPPPAVHNGKPGHHLQQQQPPPHHITHLHHGSHPMPLHSHLMHPGLSPTSSNRTTPPGTMPPSMTNSSPSPHAHSHLLAHHPNGLVAIDANKAVPSQLAPTDPEAFRWVNSYREPISIIR